MKPGVLVLNFGGPQNASELRPFLSRLLADVLPGPKWVAGPMGKAVARLRAPKVQPAYESIGWSPLVPQNAEQVAALRDKLDLPVSTGMMFTAPEISDAVQELRDAGVDHIVALPMFPHFSIATTNAAFTFLGEALHGSSDLTIHHVAAWYDHPLYIESLVNTMRKGVEETPGEGELHLVFSPHGLPTSFVTKRGDPYPQHVEESARLAIEAMGWDGPWHIGWQSRVGPVEWLKPSTPEVLETLAGQGVKRVCLVPISFVNEHIETLEEIDMQFAELAEEVGIEHFGRAPALGTDPAFIACLADLVAKALDSFDVPVGQRFPEVIRFTKAWQS